MYHGYFVKEINDRELHHFPVGRKKIADLWYALERSRASVSTRLTSPCPERLFWLQIPSIPFWMQYPQYEIAT
jgi:hypothetical protein